MSYISLQEHTANAERKLDQCVAATHTIEGHLATVPQLQLLTEKLCLRLAAAAGEKVAHRPEKQKDDSMVSRGLNMLVGMLSDRPIVKGRTA